MTRYLLALAILVASPAMAWGDTIQFAVPPSNIGTLYQGGAVDLFSSGLDGIKLTGQNLSLDLVLSNAILARLFVDDPGAFGIGLQIFTNAPGFPGFAGPTTGFLLNANGTQNGGVQVAGREAGNNGTFGVGLVSYTVPFVADVSGVQFDTQFPNTGYVITNAQLRFSLNSSGNEMIFGTKEQLPESATHWDYIVLAFLCAVILYKGKQYRGTGDGETSI